MGKKSKSSRKGKKAWRANISTEDIANFYEKSTKDALSGGSFSSVPNDSLFVVDKSRDLSVKRKIEKHREKVLRSDSILHKNPFVKAVPSSIRKKSRKPKEAPKASDSIQKVTKANSGEAVAMVDMWDDKDEDTGKDRKIPKPSVIPAVEVEPPGCSFNPSFESHQDILARAVAEEMQKVYKTELGPEPVPLTVPGKAIDEEEMYFLDADTGIDEENLENEKEDNQLAESEKRPSNAKKVAKVELKRRVRRKQHLRKEAEEKKVGELGKQIDCLPDIIEEIAREDEEKQKRHLRRVTAKQERLKSNPPRLGKHKFEPAPVQVLLSDEITGSLRQLKGCCTLVKDRLKSLEKRGLIAPTGKSRRR